MMQGVVTGRLDAIIKLTIHFPDGTQEEVSAIVDTGFSGELCITEDIARRLTPLRQVQTKLADASTIRVQAYRASIEWNGRRKDVFAMQTGDDVLIGMELLLPQTLIIEALPNGRVEVK